MKKRIVWILCALAIVCIALCGCEQQREEKIETDHTDVKILFLGDSIAEGVLGPAPVIEREDYAYASVVGQINGFTYRNRSVSGHMTWQMLDFVSKEKDDNAYALISNIKTADIISVSILGNDLLQTRFSKYANAAIVGDFEELDALLEESYENVSGIVARLKELKKKNTPLIFQTVYNPAYKETTLIGDDIRSVMYENGYTDDDVYYVAGLLINRLNNVLRRYSAEHPGDIVILDVNDKFDQMYRGGGNRQLDRLIFGDDIHPSNEGHATIAVLMQELLETMRLADHAEGMKNYKILCSDRLKRLYTGTSVDVSAATKAIKAATTYAQINAAYFDATDGVTPVYEKKDVTAVSDQDNYDVYTLESVSVIGKEITFAFDMDKTTVALEKEGNHFEIRLDLTDIVMAVVRGYASNGQTGIELIWIEKYLHAMFPTESLADVRSTFARLKTDIGVEVHGFDLEDENTVAMIEGIEKEMKLPEGTEIPKDIYFSFSGEYENVTIASETRKDPFRAAYLGEHYANAEPYLILTYFEEEGVKKVLIHNDVLSLDLVAALKTPAANAD